MLHNFSVLLPSTQLQFGCFCLCSFKIRLSLQSELATGAPLSSVEWMDTLVQERYQSFHLFCFVPFAFSSCEDSHEADILEAKNSFHILSLWNLMKLWSWTPSPRTKRKNFYILLILVSEADVPFIFFNCYYLYFSKGENQSTQRLR